MPVGMTMRLLGTRSRVHPDGFMRSGPFSGWTGDNVMEQYQCLRSHLKNLGNTLLKQRQPIINVNGDFVAIVSIQSVPKTKRDVIVAGQMSISMRRVQNPRFRNRAPPALYFKTGLHLILGTKPSTFSSLRTSDPRRPVTTLRSKSGPRT